MPPKNEDLHGSAPDKCETALLLIDVINDLEFPEAEQMVDAAVEMARNIRQLKTRAREAGVPIVYVNDNFGKWKSDWRRTVEHCLHENVRGRRVVEILQPEDDDYFVLKPKHSGFFSTTLDTLLRYLGSHRLIMTGIAGNFCVLFTANDAYMRDYELVIPSDCVVSNTDKENNEALALMQKFLKAETPRGEEVELQAAVPPLPAELHGSSRTFKGKRRSTSLCLGRFSPAVGRSFLTPQPWSSFR